MKSEDLEYIFSNTQNKTKNVYKMDIVKHLPDLHLSTLKKSKINFRLNPANRRFMRTTDILRKDSTVITTIAPPHYGSNSRFSSLIVRDKIKTENYLKDFNIRTPNSKVYDRHQMALAKDEFFKHSKVNAVIKPLNGTLGKGVMVNVSEERFEEKWSEATKSLSKYTDKLIVQESLSGFEARAIVVEGTLVSIVIRTSPYVIGDGKHTIDELIEISNEEKLKCGVRKSLTIKKHDRLHTYLEDNNMDINYVPELNEYVILGAVSNVSNGGELVNITDLVCDEIKEAALNAVAAFDGLFTAGVDVIMKNFDDKNPVILEVNGYPVFYISTYPTYGEQANPSKRYVDTVIAVDQFKHNTTDKYEIENEAQLVRDYLKFVERKQMLYNDKYKEKSRYY